MFKITSDSLATFRGVASTFEKLKALVFDLIQRVSDVETRIDVLEVAPVTASSSGSGNSVTVTVDFGASFTHFAQTVVTGQSWVAVDSEISATPLAAAGAIEETALMAFSTVISDRVAGDGFTLSVYTPTEAKGTYTFSCIGV